MFNLRETHPLVKTVNFNRKWPNEIPLEARGIMDMQESIRQIDYLIFFLYQSVENCAKKCTSELAQE